MNELKKQPISVVVCVKNEEKRIENCLKSIQNNNVDEIILVDGNSKDKTIEIAKKFTDKIYISNKNSLTADRQIGIDKAKNDYIAMIDADHILRENDIDGLLNDIIKFNFDIVQSQLTSYDKNNFFNKAEDEAWQINHNYSGSRKMIGTAPAMYRKKIFDYIKFDEKITSKMDDTDFYYRLSKNKKFKYGVGDTKITQYHFPSLSSYIKKFIWYGYGDAEFIRKYPFKIFTIIYHQLIRYVIIYPAISIVKLKWKAAIFFIITGIFRFLGMFNYIYLNAKNNK